MTGAGPPKCKTCGATEWQHLCSGAANKVVKVAKALALPAPEPEKKTDRKEYLKLKARERRAREKGAKG